mmetsp:Transcript_30871/g.45292  ORF Transcript_30871/g.45292 Transcript_30871/m.45292 type:complete len:167 (+) Transcript_30871:52-552(+)
MGCSSSSFSNPAQATKSEVKIDPRCREERTPSLTPESSWAGSDLLENVENEERAPLGGGQPRPSWGEQGDFQNSDVEMNLDLKTAEGEDFDDFQKADDVREEEAKASPPPEIVYIDCFPKIPSIQEEEDPKTADREDLYKIEDMSQLRFWSRFLCIIMACHSDHFY